MAKLSSIKSDVLKETKGVWVEYENTGIEALVARVGNAEYAKFIREKTRPKPGHRQKRFTNEDMEAIVKEAICRHCWLGLRGADDEEGKPIVYTPEVGMRLMGDPEYRDFVQFVSLSANDMQLFRAEAIEEVLGD